MCVFVYVRVRINPFYSSAKMHTVPYPRSLCIFLTFSHLALLYTFIQGLGVVVRHQHRIQNVVCHLLLVRSSSCSASSILWVRIDSYHLIHHRLPAAGPATFTHILSAPFPNSLNLSFHPSLPSLTIEHIGTIHMGSGKTSSVAETTQPRQWLGT